MNLRKKLSISFAIAISSILLFSTIVLAAWEYQQRLSITDTSGTNRTNLLIATGINSQNYIDQGYANSAFTNTNMQIASSDIPYFPTNSNSYIYIDSLSAYQEKTVTLLTGYTPAQTEFPIIVNSNGYVTITDDATLEISNDGSIEGKSYIDSSASNSKYLVLKPDALRVYPDSGDITADILSTGTQTENLYPDGVGSETNIASVVGAATHWQATNDSSDASYVSTTSASYERDLYSCDDTAVTWSAQGTINSVTFYIRAASVATATMYLKPSMYTNDTAYDGAEQTGGLAISNYSEVFTTNPVTSNEWTWDEIDDLEIGVSIKRGAGGSANCYEVWIVVSYEEVTVEKTVTASTVSEGLHTWKVSLDTTDLEIIIDEGEASEISDSIALGVITIPNNSENWKILNGDSCLYSNYYIHTVSSVEKTRFEPDNLITSTTLEDETGSNDGTITFGSNPANITISYNEFESYDSYYSTISETGSDNIDSYEEDSDWEVTGTFAGDLTPEIKEVIANAASGIGMEQRALWMLLMFGVAIAVALGVMLFTGSQLLTATTMIALLIYGVQAQVIDGGFVLVIAITTFAIMYLLRHN